MIVGIDLGTCYSAIGRIVDGRPELISNALGSRITPSCVAIGHDGVHVGEEAEYVKFSPDYVYLEKFKTHMGTDISFDTVYGSFTPQWASTQVIKHLVQYAERQTGDRVESGVVTVPAYFTILQRKLTKEAAEHAGLKVDRIISEPTAAALAIGEHLPAGTKILVYDLGGGTFDCSVLEVQDSLAIVRATRGNTHLGGQDFDKALALLVAPSYEDFSDTDRSIVLEAAEKAKKELGVRDVAFVNCSLPQYGIRPASVTYKDFKASCSLLMDDTKGCIFNCLKDADLEPSDIDRVYMVGGSTRMRLVGDLLRSLFVPEPMSPINPDEAVAIGATMHASTLSGGQGSLLIDVIPLSLGVTLEDGNFKRIVRRNTPIPCESQEVFTTAYDGQQAVDVEVLQGENEISKNNHRLGSLRLSGIESALRGEPQIAVKFAVDADGVVSVSAEDLKSGAETATKFDFSLSDQGALEDDSVDLMVLSIKSAIRMFLDTRCIVPDETVSHALLGDNVELLQAVWSDLQDSNAPP